MGGRSGGSGVALAACSATEYVEVCSKHGRWVGSWAPSAGIEHIGKSAGSSTGCGGARCLVHMYMLAPTPPQVQLHPALPDSALTVLASPTACHPPPPHPLPRRRAVARAAQGGWPRAAPRLPGGDAEARVRAQRAAPGQQAGGGWMVAVSAQRCPCPRPRPMAWAL